MAPRALVALGVLSSGAAIGVAAVLPVWWPLAMLPTAVACFAAWGLLARVGARRPIALAVGAMRLLVAAAGTLAAVLFPVGLLLMLYADLSMDGSASGAKGGGSACTYDGRWHSGSDCPTAERPAPMEAQVLASVIDSMYFGLARQRAGVQRERVLLEARAPAAASLPGVAMLPALLEPALEERTGAVPSLVAAFRAANAGDSRHHTLVTVAEEQELLDTAAIRRFLTDDYGRPGALHHPDEYVAYAGALGVLTLSRAAIDSVRGLALVFAGLRTRDGPAIADTPYSYAEYVLLRRDGGGWKVWKGIPVER
jgi:hypothetical protein